MVLGEQRNACGQRTAQQRISLRVPADRLPQRRQLVCGRHIICVQDTAEVHEETQRSTGWDRNSSTGMPFPPMSSPRPTRNSLANASSPGCFTSAAPLARDTVFAAAVITMNGIVGLSLLLGSLKYGLTHFNAEGTGSALATVTALATLSLVVPSFTTSRPGPEFSPGQLIALTIVVSVLTVVPGRATRLQGGVHLVLLAAFVFLSISP